MKIVVHVNGFQRASEGRECGQCDPNGTVEPAERRQIQSGGHDPGQRFFGLPDYLGAHLAGQGAGQGFIKSLLTKRRML